mgnify:CR=1 FL=1
MVIGTGRLERQHASDAGRALQALLLRVHQPFFRRRTIIANQQHVAPRRLRGIDPLCHTANRMRAGQAKGRPENTQRAPA